MPDLPEAHTETLAAIDELAEMRKMGRILDRFDQRARDRIIVYLFDRYMSAPRTEG